MLKTDKAALSAALSIAGAIVKPNAKMPAMQNILIERDGETMIARGGDPDMEISTKFQAVASDDFQAFLAPKEGLTEFVRNAPDNAITIDPVINAGQFSHITLRSAKSRLKLPVLSGDMFPRLDAGPLKASVTLTSSILRDALTSVSYAASSDVSDFYIGGVLFEADAEGLNLVATDRLKLERRLIRRIAFDDDAALDTLPRVTISSAIVARIIKLIDSEDDITLELSDHQVRVSIGNTLLVGKLIEGTFPEWQRIIATPSTNQVTLDAAPLSEALGRVMLATPDAGNGVTFRFAENSLTLVARDIATGEGEDTIAAEVGSPMVIGLHGRNVRMALDHMNGSRAEILLGDSKHPVRLRAVGNADNFTVLLPMQPKGGLA